MQFFLVTTLVLLGADAPARSWSDFLGVGAPSPPANSLPLEWAPDRNIAWQAKTPGFGQSSPVVWGGSVYVTSVEGPEKNTYHITAVKLDDGSIQWTTSFDASVLVADSFYVSRAAPTAAVDAQGVYAFFESGDVAAVDHVGKVLWKRSLADEFGEFKAQFGLAASLAQDERAIYLLAEHEGPSYLLALDKQTGKSLWKTDRPSRISWSSPILLPLAGKHQLVISSPGSVEGYDPENGARLWQVDGLGGNTVCSPLPAGENRVLVGAAPGRDGNDAAEAARSNLCLEVKQEGDQWQAEVIWRTDAVASFASPMAHQGYAYWINRVGVLSCVSLEDGQSVYAERLDQSCWATPLAVGDRLYCFGKDGATTVISAGPEFRRLAKNQLWDPEAVQLDAAELERETTPERRAAASRFAGPTQYGVAAVEGSLLIRTGRNLYCLRNEAD